MKSSVYSVHFQVDFIWKTNLYPVFFWCEAEQAPHQRVEQCVSVVCIAYVCLDISSTHSK